MKKIKGFTLVETVITVAIISILATIAAPSFVKTIEATKARKVSDFVVQLVNYAKSDALNKNKNVYMTIAAGSVCLSYTQKSIIGHACDVRSDAIQEGTVISLLDTDGNHEIIFDGIYGIPNTAATIKVETSSSVKNIFMTILGFVSVV